MLKRNAHLEASAILAELEELSIGLSQRFESGPDSVGGEALEEWTKKRQDLVDRFTAIDFSYLDHEAIESIMGLLQSQAGADRRCIDMMESLLSRFRREAGLLVEKKACVSAYGGRLISSMEPAYIDALS